MTSHWGQASGERSLAWKDWFNCKPYITEFRECNTLKWKIHPTLVRCEVRTCAPLIEWKSQSTNYLSKTTHTANHQHSTEYLHPTLMVADLERNTIYTDFDDSFQHSINISFSLGKFSGILIIYRFNGNKSGVLDNSVYSLSSNDV